MSDRTAELTPAQKGVATRRARQAEAQAAAAERRNAALVSYGLTGNEPREMECLGMDDDGTLYLWDVCNVQPVSAFETADKGKWIKSGHYLIAWRGHAVTVHLGNCDNGLVSVLFMCCRGNSIPLPRKIVEPMLLGRIIPDPVASAAISEDLKKLAELWHQDRTRADRRRGSIAEGRT